MMDNDALFYILAMLRCDGVGDASARKLLEYFGSAQEVFAAKARDLDMVDRLSKNAKNAILEKKTFDRAEEELKFIKANNIKVYAITEEDYPQKLKHCVDVPLVLFANGNVDFDNKRIISVVGTRSNTQYGISFCKEFVASLKAYNPIIVSGFALGTDICVHVEAMDNGLQTIGVLAHGLDMIYPPKNSKYVARMKENGGFITEFWSKSIPERENFVRRNRIVAGISDATIVVESAKKGGSLITAHLANDYNREVFALPGKSSDTYSKGCNHLIKTQRALLIENVDDLVYNLNWEQTTTKAVQKKLFVDLNAEEQKVYDFLLENKKEQLDILAKSCGLPVFRMASMLFDLEMKGVVRPLPGKMFELQ
ncbi:MAG: DNA-processing protein DprA [Bacteroidota bacterium]|nr:DNA-processing protein DprA [Bacteroidota bacterium]